jgi:hypothetical protein
MLPSGLYPIVPAIGAISPSEFARASSGSGHANHHCTRRSRACWGTIGASAIAPQTRTAVIEHEVNDVVRLLPPKIVCAKDPNGGPECAQ